MKGGNKLTWIYWLTLAPGEGVLPYVAYTGISAAKQGVKAKLLELRVFFVFLVRVYLQLVVIVYSFLLLYCLLSFWCHHRCIMLRNLSSFLV